MKKRDCLIKVLGNGLIAGGRKMHRAKRAGWATMIVLVLLCECPERACTQHGGDNKRCTRCAFHGSTSVATDVYEIPNRAHRAEFVVYHKIGR